MAAETKCDECGGSGKISIPGGRTTSGVVGLRTSRSITCPKCQGTGEVGDLTQALVKCKQKCASLEEDISELEQLRAEDDAVIKGLEGDLEKEPGATTMQKIQVDGIDYWAHPRLVAYIRKMERHNFSLAAGVCPVEGGLLGDDGGTPYCTLQKSMAAKPCQNPIEKRGEKYEVAWGEKRRDYEYTDCGTCETCQAKLAFGIELGSRKVTR